MISAMYENGGNTTHRLFDGHPEVYTYPFESQLGTRLVVDHLSGMFPFKYRWPEFPLQADPVDDYELIYDEELKVRLRAPHVSKFRDADLQMCENERKQLFEEHLGGRPRTRRRMVEAFFQATFGSWRNCQRSGREVAWVGYSPIVAVDTDKILADFPDAHVVHVVRNPLSAYAETKLRPFPLSLQRYVWAWNIVQHFALVYAQRFPESFHILRYEDLLRDPKLHLSGLCSELGLGFSDSLLYPSWNGRRLATVHPWGTIKEPSLEANRRNIVERLTEDERAEILGLSRFMLESLGYSGAEYGTI
jgi:hypothetical protein